MFCGRLAQACQKLREDHKLLFYELRSVPFHFAIFLLLHKRVVMSIVIVFNQKIFNKNFFLIKLFLKQFVSQGP